MDKAEKATNERDCSDYRQQIIKVLEKINSVEFLVKIYSFAKVFLEE